MVQAPAPMKPKIDYGQKISKKSHAYIKLHSISYGLSRRNHSNYWIIDQISRCTLCWNWNLVWYFLWISWLIWDNSKLKTIVFIHCYFYGDDNNCISILYSLADLIIPINSIYKSLLQI